MARRRGIAGKVAVRQWPLPLRNRLKGTRPVTRAHGVLPPHCKESKMEKVWIWLAWKLPKRLAYWAAIRLGAHATGEKYPTTVVPEVTFVDVLKRAETM
jgi:hypothetical protein